MHQCHKDKNIHIIIGGDDKGASLKPLFENIKNLDIVIYAIGSNTQRVLNYCEEFKISCVKCEYLEEAVKNIDKNLKENSIGILSPAAASLDQFKSYAHRGDEFKKFVRNLS